MISIFAGIVTVILFLIICVTGIGSTYFTFIDDLRKNDGEKDDVKTGRGTR